MRLGDQNPLFDSESVISTGSRALDHALGIGGLPQGHLVEMSGPQHSGKTTLALHVIAEAQKRGGTCVFINTEQALDPAYARRVGVDVENLFISQPDDSEQGLDIIEQLVKSHAVHCVVMDSLTTLLLDAEVERDVGNRNREERVLSQALRRLTRSAAKSKCLLVCLHHSGVHNKGAKVLHLRSAVRLAFVRGQTLRGETHDVGYRIRVKVVKNKVARPFGTSEIDVLFDKGIDRLGELLDIGVALGLVYKKKAWFVLKDLAGGKGGRMGAEGSLVMGQGREKTRFFLQERPELVSMLENAVGDRLKTMDSYMRTLPASKSRIREEEEEEEEEREVEVRNLAEATADAEAVMNQVEQEREGAYAYPFEQKSERGLLYRAGGKDSANAQDPYVIAPAEERWNTNGPTRMMDTIEHFGAGAGGEGVDLEIDYLTGEVKNTKAAAAVEAAAAAAAAAGQKNRGEGSS